MCQLTQVGCRKELVFGSPHLYNKHTTKTMIERVALMARTDRDQHQYNRKHRTPKTQTIRKEIHYNLVIPISQKAAVEKRLHDNNINTYVFHELPEGATFYKLDGSDKLLDDLINHNPDTERLIYDRYMLNDPYHSMKMVGVYDNGAVYLEDTPITRLGFQHQKKVDKAPYGVVAKYVGDTYTVNSEPLVLLVAWYEVETKEYVYPSLFHQDDTWEDRKHLINSWLDDDEKHKPRQKFGAPEKNRAVKEANGRIHNGLIDLI